MTTPDDKEHDKLLCERLATTVDHGICKCAERHRIAELEAALQACRDLMAVVHCDGGHYREAHGDRKAADDAIAIVSTLRVELADERERRKAAEALLVELIAVADENDALMMERLYGKPHGVEHKARTLDHMQRKSEAWRNARVYLTRYKD